MEEHTSEDEAEENTSGDEVEENSSGEEVEENTSGEEGPLSSDLKNITFENLQKIQEEMGSKKYKELLLKKNEGKKIRVDQYKRENKNRPRECSSKIPVKNYIKEKKVQSRDPRFDSLCGTYNDKAFKKAYKFVDAIKEKEKRKLQKLAKRERNPENQEKMKYLLQRMENQDREKKRQELKEVKKIEEDERRLRLLSEGKKPHFPKKSEKKLFDLVDKFEELKEQGKLKKHFKKKNKVNSRLPGHLNLSS